MKPSMRVVLPFNCACLLCVVYTLFTVYALYFFSEDEIYHFIDFTRAMEVVQDAKKAQKRREEQLERWDISDTNKESDRPRNSEKSLVKFDDGCVFLAACSSCDTDEVERLLSNGADINTTNVDGLTALHQVCDVFS